jgi:hypothetical protein
MVRKNPLGEILRRAGERRHVISVMSGTKWAESDRPQRVRTRSRSIKSHFRQFFFGFQFIYTTKGSFSTSGLLSAPCLLFEEFSSKWKKRVGLPLWQWIQLMLLSSWLICRSLLSLEGNFALSMASSISVYEELWSCFCSLNYGEFSSGSSNQRMKGHLRKGTQSKGPLSDLMRERRLVLGRVMTAACLIKKLPTPRKVATWDSS